MVTVPSYSVPFVVVPRVLCCRRPSFGCGSRPEGLWKLVCIIIVTAIVYRVVGRVVPIVVFVVVSSLVTQDRSAFAFRRNRLPFVVAVRFAISIR